MAPLFPRLTLWWTKSALQLVAWGEARFESVVLQSATSRWKKSVNRGKKYGQKLHRFLDEDDGDVSIDTEKMRNSRSSSTPKWFVHLGECGLDWSQNVIQKKNKIFQTFTWKGLFLRLLVSFSFFYYYFVYEASAHT